MKVTLPIRTVNTLNTREHWSKRAKRAKKDREAGYYAGYMALPKGRLVVHAYRVTLTRIAPRTMDGDGLQASFKGIRDGVADAIDLDDGSKLITWVYAQRKGRPKEYAVEVEIESR